MQRHNGIVAEGSNVDDQRGRGCSCAPHAPQDGSGAAATSCACDTVDKVVRRSRRTGAADVAKVAAFVALLVAVVLALWR
jgi:hypothetical protein